MDVSIKLYYNLYWLRRGLGVVFYSDCSIGAVRGGIGTESGFARGDE